MGRRKFSDGDIVVGAQRTNQGVLLPHGVKMLSEIEWQAAQHRQFGSESHNSTDVTFALEYAFERDGKNVNEWYPFSVGLNSRNRKVATLKGADKYRRGYIDAYIIASLIKMFPEGHDNIYMAVSHPADALPYLRDLLDVVTGKHRVMLPSGREIDYTIRYALTYDEPAGAVVRAMTTYSIQDMNSLNLNPGMSVLVCDIGGFLSSFYFARLNYDMAVEVDFNRGRTFNFGIEQVKAQLEAELRSMYPDIFKHNISPETLDEIIRNKGVGFVYGKEADFTQAFKNATAPLLDTIENIYSTDLGGAHEARMIFNSGGGSAVLFNVLVDEIYNHPAHLADAVHRIQFANVEGGAEILRQWAEMAQRDPKTKKRIWSTKAKQEPVGVATDPGNAYIKTVQAHAAF